MLSENIWFTWCKPSNYSIFGEGKSDDGQMDKQTDRHNYLSETRPLLWKRSSKKEGRGNESNLASGAIFYSLKFCQNKQHLQNI